MIEYYKDQLSRGYINPQEQKFLKQGVVFSVLKLFVFSMRPDEIAEKVDQIKKGKYHLLETSSDNAGPIKRQYTMAPSTLQSDTASNLDLSPMVRDKSPGAGLKSFVINSPTKKPEDCNQHSLPPSNRSKTAMNM